MLRLAIRAVAALWLAGAIVLAFWSPVQWPMLIPTTLVMLGTFYEKRYTGMPAPEPAALFEPTAERFVDPETGRVNRVLVDPRTGARRYVDEGEPLSPAP